LQKRTIRNQIGAILLSKGLNIMALQQFEELKDYKQKDIPFRTPSGKNIPRRKVISAPAGTAKHVMKTRKTKSGLKRLRSK
jgi:hypothetical protein